MEVLGRFLSIAIQGVDDVSVPNVSIIGANEFAEMVCVLLSEIEVRIDPLFVRFWSGRVLVFMFEFLGLLDEPVAVFRFLSEDWSPRITLLHMRKRWPELSFKLIPSYFRTV